MLVDGNNFIRHHLKNNKPFAAGKIGITELNLLYCYFQLKNNGPLLEHLKHEAEDIAGLYPYNDKTVIEFSENMLRLLPSIDLIPVWNNVIPQFEKYIFDNYCPNSYKTKIEMLEPFFDDAPWTDYLKDKTVLVFSPFAESIKENFKSFDKIWNNKIKNNFELKVYKYPFALTLSDKNEFKASNEVYKHFLDILNKETFDVGIFGTGYTSLLYTLEAKKLNKTGIHLGGGTQILFGIKGHRWKQMDRFVKIFNEHWTEPKSSEKPPRYKKCEGGGYW
jgi:hypothetical protein